MWKAFELKGIVERIVQFGLVGIAAFVVALWEPEEREAAWIAAFVVVVLYIGLAGAVYFLVHLIDERSVFVGKYLSVHATAGSYAIFEIHLKRFESGYGLSGRAYKVENQLVTSSGSWDADHVLLHAKDRRVQYIYYGGRTGESERHGYASIKFTSRDMSRGAGAFVDDTDEINARRETSRYVKLTAETLEEVFGDKDRKVSTEKEELEFVNRFAALDPATCAKIVRVA